MMNISSQHHRTYANSVQLGYARAHERLPVICIATCEGPREMPIDAVGSARNHVSIGEFLREHECFVDERHRSDRLLSLDAISASPNTAGADDADLREGKWRPEHESNVRPAP